MKKKKETERPKYNMLQNTAYIIGLSWKVRKSVIFVCLAMAGVAVATNLVELFFAPVVLGKVETAAEFKDLVTTIVVFAAALMVLAALKAYIEQNTMPGRSRVNQHLLKLVNRKAFVTSYPNMENPSSLNKFERAVRTVIYDYASVTAVWDILAKLGENIVGLIVYVMILSTLDPILMAVTTVTTIFAFIVTRRIYNWGFLHREEKAGYNRRMTYACQRGSDVALAKDIRIFRMRPWLEEFYQDAMRQFKAFALRRETIYIRADFLDIGLLLLRNGFAYAYLISMTLREGLPASQFLLYFTALNGFSNWISGILTNVISLHRTSLEISVVREFLELSEPFLFEEGKPVTKDRMDAYEIQLKDVSFRYPGAEKDTIHNLNLTIRPGEKLAVVGLNGAGKTTLVKLICGFLDPTEGAVLLNGQDIRQFNRAEYYKLFSAVFQQFSTLEITLAENVAQSMDEIDMERVEQCIEKAGLTERVARMPKGYNTYIGRKVYEDGVELSGGETQRLMLARALYKDGKIIVLDEPTAALDPVAENDIYLKYNEMTAGRTSVYISHRLASTRFCDRIIFLAGGQITEEGTHDSLMKLGGNYADLFRVQSKYYQEGGAADEA